MHTATVDPQYLPTDRKYMSLYAQVVIVGPWRNTVCDMRASASATRGGVTVA